MAPVLAAPRSLDHDPREAIARQILVFAAPSVVVGAAICLLVMLLHESQRERVILPTVLIALGAVVAGVLAAAGRARLGLAWLSAALLGGILTAMYCNGGVTAPGYLVSVPLVVLVASVHGTRWTLGFMALTLISGLAFLAAENASWIRTVPWPPPPVHYVFVSVITCVTGFFAIVPNRMLSRALRERERQAEELARAHATEQARSLEFVAVFNQTFQQMSLLAPDGRVVRVNSTALDLIGITAEAVIGVPYAETAWWTDDQRALITDAIGRAGRGERVRFQAVQVRFDGSARTIDLSLVPFHDPHGAVVHLIAEGRDITDLAEAEARLRQSDKLESLGMLAGYVAHDFNNVLAAILGYADLLTLRSPDPRVHDCANRIVGAADQGRDLTTSLLALVRKSAAGAVTYDVHDAVSAAVRLFRALRIQRIRTILRLDCAESTVVGWPTQLQNALLNLLLNARDAMPDGGSITLSTAIDHLDQAACTDLQAYKIQAGRFLRLDLSDTGSGMAPEVLAHCLEPFFTTKGDRGTGLGLPSVQSTVSAHHGAMRVTSQPGQGTTFSLWFPLAGDPPPEPPALAGSVQAPERSASLPPTGKTAVPA